MKKILLNPLVIIALCFLTLIAVLVVTNILYEPPPAVPIDENALTAKQLAVLCDEYVKAYGVTKDLFLSDIFMRVDKDHKGEINMTYSYVERGRRYRYYVDVNTEEHMIYSIYQIDKSVVASSEFMDFTAWKVDSDEAVSIALAALRDRGYEINDSEIWIRGIRSLSGDNWDISFYADINRERYGRSPTVFVDAYTGEVSSYFW